MKRVSVTSAGILILVSAFLWREYAVSPNGDLTAVVLDVGQGDAILLQGPHGERILVDGGPDLSVLEELPRHMPFFNRTIDMLVVTHSDADHTAGLAEIVRRYDVRSVLTNGDDHASGAYEAFLATLEERGTAVILAEPSTDIRFESGLALDIIHPEKTAAFDVNNRSVVFRALYESGSTLLTGDIEKEAEADILASGRPVRASVIKVPHHGSRTSSSTGFLLQVHPKTALISAAGSAHRLNHPHPDVVERYDRLGIRIRRTDAEGALEEPLR